VKRWFSILAITLLVVMTACSSETETGGANSDEGGENGNSNENVTITFGLWNKDQVSAYEPVFKKFEEENPNINVEIQVTPWEQYWTKLETAATGSVLPDVFWMNGPNFIKYASNGILFSLDKYIKQGDTDLKNYPKSLVNLYTFDDTSYAIPKDFDTIGLYYNKALFDAAGVSYPDDSWDWNDLIEAAEKLTDPEKGVWGIAAKMNNHLGYYNTIFQAGGNVVSDDMKDSGYDDPATINGLKFWTNLIHKYKVSPTLAQMTDTAPRSLFQSGKVAMLFDGSWMAGVNQENNSLKGKVEVAVLPKGKQRATVIHGLGHAIAANTKHPDAAWKLVEFLGSKEVNQMFAETGLFIPAFNGTQQKWVESIPEMNLQVFIDMVEYAEPYPVSKNTAKWQNLENEHFSKAWAGQESIEEMAKKAAEKMNEILAQE
jgi:multiple sugar transport system substrate-binding protein